MKRGLIFVLLLFVMLIGSVSAVSPPKILVSDKLPGVGSLEPFLEDLPKLDLRILQKETSNSQLTSALCSSNLVGADVDYCQVNQDLTLIPGTYPLKGIWITADNIVFDCNGATLVGSCGYICTAIEVLGNNNTIKNCQINNFSYGVSTGSPLATIFNQNTIINNIFNTTMGAMSIVGSSNNLSYNTINDFSDPNFVYAGIRAESGIGGEISHNTINGGGITVTDVNNSVISYNVITQSSQGGISIASSRVIVNNNNISNSMMGIVLPDVYPLGSFIWEDVNISNNKLTENSYGLIIRYANKTLVHGNNISYNSNDGIQTGFTTLTEIFDNVISWNKQGIHGAKSEGVDSYDQITNNQIVFNGFNGVFYSIPKFLNISYNNFSFNGHTGIYFGDERCNGTTYVDDAENYIFQNTMYFNAYHGFLSNININLVNNEQYGLRNFIFNNSFINSWAYCGVYLSNHTANNEVYDNIFVGNPYGVCLGFTENNTIRENVIDNSAYNLYYYDAPNNQVYLNSITSGVQFNVYSNTPMEVSYGGIGNYWGHSFPGPCFIPGGDSISVNIQDSYAYCDGVPNNILIKIPTFGWYFFGSNLVPLDFTIESVLRPIVGHYDLVQSFVNGIGKQYKPGNPFNDLNTISPQNGYWMKVTSTPLNDLVIVGNEVNPSGCYKLSLTPTPSPTSWVGYWASGTQPIGTALSSIDGSYSLVRTYKNGAWTTYDPVLPMFSDLDFMVPGQGYVITMINSDDLDYLGGFCPP